MKHIFEPGDEFRIDPQMLGHKCTAKKKTYIIDHISKYGNTAYYKDNRTNIKCRCHQCTQGLPNRWSGYDPEKKEFKSVMIEYIILTKPKTQRNREIALNILLGRKT